MESLSLDQNVTGFLITALMFGFAAMVVAALLYARHRARQMRYELIRAALEKGQPLPPELLEASTPQPPGSDLSRGVKLLSLGIGLVAFFGLMREHAWPVGFILIFLGLGYLASHWLTRPREKGPAGGS